MDSPSADHPPRRSTRRRRQLDWFDRPAEVLLVAIVFASVLPLGSVPFWAMWANAGLALVGGALGAAALPKLPRPVWVLLGLGLFSALQALPLPLSWVALLSPHAADTWARSLLPFGAGAPRFASLSVDSGASLAEALKWLSYASVFLLASRIRTQRGTSWLAAVVFVGGASVALLTLLHGAIDARLVFGIYEPTFKVPRWSVGPLINSNNLAGYVNLGTFAGLGLLLTDRSPLPRWLVALGLAPGVAAVALSSSRGGVIAALVGAAVLAFAFWRERALLRRMPSLRVLAPVGGGLLLVVALTAAKNLDGVTLGDVTRKVAAWKWSWGLLADYPWFGVGRGAFETALPPYRTPLAHDWSASFSHAENFVVQWIVDWGVLVGSAAVVSIVGYCLWVWLKARHRPHAFALMTGVLVLLLQNLVDLGLELTSLTVLAIVALVGSSPSQRLRRPQERTLVRSAVLVATAPLAVAWLASAFFARFPVNVERADLRARYEALDVRHADERAEYRAALGAAMGRHPGEHFFPLLGALVAYRAGDQNPIPWISRALALSPISGPVHLALGEIVGRQGNLTQAMLHFRLAAEYDSTMLAAAGRRAALRAPSVELLMQAIPEGTRGENMLLGACMAAPTRSFQLECWQRAVVRAPQSVAIARQHIEILLRILADDGQDCADELARVCTEELEAAIRRLATLMPNAWEPGYYRAKLLSRRGEYAEAARLLSATCPPGPSGTECVREFVVAALAAESEELRAKAVDAFSARECGTPSACAAANDWLAIKLAATGHSHLALVHGTRAAEGEPSAARWLRVAELALTAHRYADARTAIARSEHAPDATAQTHASGERIAARILRASFGRTR